MSFGPALLIAIASALVLSGCAPAEVAPAGPAPIASSTAATVSPSAAPATTEPPPVTPAPAEEKPPRLQPPEVEVDSVWNFRDVAGKGAGLPVADGGHMARGVVYRSGKLKGLSRADKRELVKAGVTDIFDLRTDEVALRTPDPAIGRADYHLVNIWAVYSHSDANATSVKEAMELRQDDNRTFASNPKQRQQIGKLLEGIAKADGAAIIHCTEGKDRTGWASAVLQLIAGVDEKTIVTEYLLSNERRADFIEHHVAKVRKAKGRAASEVKRAQLEVHESYLLAGLDELRTRYGGIEEYLSDGLGLSQSTIDTLRDKLVLP